MTSFFLYLYVGTMLSVSGPYQSEHLCQNVGYIGVAIASRSSGASSGSVRDTAPHFECVRGGKV